MSAVPRVREYCADLCLASGEPMLGTAAQVDVWLLLEYKPTWRPKATEDNDLTPAMRAWLQRTVGEYAALGLKARPQFVRQPEIDSDLTTLFVAKEGRLLRFEGEGYTEIQHLDIETAPLTEVRKPHYFVCTNGQRDLCCARYGLPTYAELRDAVDTRAWQTTHLGGHRFAPNVLALPQGALYGRVFPDDVTAFVAAVEAGELCVEYLRGRAAYPPQAQVAEARLPDNGALKAIDGDAVRFATVHGERTVTVQRAQTPYRIIASCGRTETEAVYPYV